MSPTEFEVVLYLNQMGEFNYIGKMIEILLFFRVLSPTEFEVVLYLNQMGEFNFIGKIEK